MTDILHDDEIPIDIGLVRKLVDDQFPQYASLPLHELGASGSSNLLFRLDEKLLVRLPRQPGGGRTIHKEQHWTSRIGRQLPIAVPEIVAIGEPADEYPEHWSIVAWLDGQLPRSCTPGGPADAWRSQLASDLADVILALRAIDIPEDVPDGSAVDGQLRGYRGRSLAEFDRQFQKNVRHCRAIEDLNLDLDSALAIWNDSLDLPGALTPAADRWYHGDLVAENLLLNNGRLTGVLDFGGLCIGDPTIDLHGAWELFDASAREVFRARLGVDEAEWLRGRAWALAIALGAISYYWTKMPDRMRNRMAMARAVLIDAGDDFKR
jgi:aminoglycoside phosphotransferase (APT) family kinase protein